MPTPRTWLAGSLACALLAAGCGGDARGREPAPGSTLRSTLIDRDGDGVLERGPGELLVDRTELGGGGPAGAALATFAQLTDTHIRDEESPARVPFLDRLGGPFRSTFRPQEALSAQVLDASVRSLNRLRPQAVAVTGDIADNAQGDELAWARTLLDGGRVRPDSGDPGYRGVQEASNPDGLIYRPDNDAPRHPGLLAQAQAPFTATGLRASWYPALGNHDLLAQGEGRPTAAIQAVATGDRAVTALDPRVRPDPDADPTDAVEAALDQGLPGRTRRVIADPARRMAGADKAISELGRTPRNGRLDYTFDIGRSLRAIVLDTVDREGGSSGVVAADQVQWLRAELRRTGTRYVVVFSHHPLEKASGGEAALVALDAAPRVVATIAGDRHRNLITARPSGPYWQIGTSSLADFPQQARFFRLLRTARGVVLETWMVDHDGGGLSGTARELAFLDAQGGRPQRFAGTRDDRNVRLHLPASG